MLKLLFLTLLQIPRGDRTLTPTNRTLNPTNRILTSKNRLFLPVKNDRKEEGFSILEVLVTILVITGFLLGSLQATLLATVMRVQAQDKQEASNWIQQDLELIRYEAFILQGTNSTGNPTTGSDATQCTSTNLADKYGSRLRNTIISKNYKANQIIEIKDGNAIRPYRVSRQYTVPTASPNILQINYIVKYAETSVSSPTHPHPRYIIGGDNVVTTLSTEILPNAALNCP